MKDTGFSIEPDKVKKLTGFPKHESVVFKVTCQTTEILDVGSIIETSMPLEIKDGPTYRLLFKATIVTPDVTLSMEKGTIQFFFYLF